MSRLPSTVQKPKPNKILIPAIIVGSLLVGAVLLGALGWLMRPAITRLVAQLPVAPGSTIVQASAMEAASKPVLGGSNTLTATDVMTSAREFRMRQYVEGYKLRGERNAESDALALGLVSNWIACNYNGAVDTNLPPL